MFCSTALDQQFITVLPLEERITWLWAAFIVFGIPELGMFMRSARICFFKTAKKPTFLQFSVVSDFSFYSDGRKAYFEVGTYVFTMACCNFQAFIVETLHTIGVAMLVLLVLPDIDVVKGAMLMNAMCIVPAIFNFLSRDPTDANYFTKLVLDILAISAQATAFVVWPLLDGDTILWCIPFACFFISLTWWENFIITPNKNRGKMYLKRCFLTKCCLVWFLSNLVFVLQ